MRGKFEGTQAHAEEAVEFIDVRAVLVGDINPQAVVGKTDAFGIQTAIVGVSGIVIGIEIVRVEDASRSSGIKSRIVRRSTREFCRTWSSFPQLKPPAQGNLDGAPSREGAVPALRFGRDFK